MITFFIEKPVEKNKNGLCKLFTLFIDKVVFKLNCIVLNVNSFFSFSFFLHHILQVPSREIDKSESRFWTHWNRETKQVRVWQCLFFTRDVA